MKWIKLLAGPMGVAGIIWFFQGINVIPGSFMTGDIRWAIAGIISFGIALFLWRKED